MDYLKSLAPLSIVFSAIAVIISFFALMESKKKRKKDSESKLLYKQLEQCDEALEKLVYDKKSIKSREDERWQQLLAIGEVMDEELLNLEGDEREEYYSEYMSIKTNYEKLVGKRLGMSSDSLMTTASIYKMEDFPQELDDFYNRLLSRAHTRKQEIVQQLKRQ